MHQFHFHAVREPVRGDETSSSNAVDRMRFGDWVFRLVGGWVEEEASEPGSRTITAGPWPEPPGLRFEFDGDRWRLVPDHASIVTVFFDAHARDGSGPSVSTVFTDLLRSSGGAIRPGAIEEVVLIGHVLGRGTIVDGVDRIGQGEAIEFTIDGRFRIVKDGRSDPLSIQPDADSYSQGRACVATDDAEGTCIELTGGLDSRLSLASFLAAGCLPGSAMTFGGAHDPDVKIASELSAALGIRHHRLDPIVESPASIRQAAFHVLATGGLISLGKYVVLMKGLDGASAWRRRQASGLGGELGIDFYAAPVIDQATLSGVLGPVIRQRVIQTPPALASRARAGVGRAVERISDDIRDRLKQEEGGGFDVLRRFYVRERMANWAFVGLNANRQEYDLSLPLLSTEYLAWSNALAPELRRGRRGQEQLLAELIGDLPHGAHVIRASRSSAVRGVRRGVDMAFKLLRKVVAKVDPRRDVDVVTTLHLALQDPVFAEALRDLEEIEVFGRHFSIDDLVSIAPSAGSLVGMYLTAMAVITARETEFKGPGLAGA